MSADPSGTVMANRTGAPAARPVANLVEILVVSLVALAVVGIGWRLVGEEPLARQAVVWVANVLMLATIWAGLRLRGEGWERFGLRFRRPAPRAILRAVLQSLAVAAVALAAFAAGSVVAAPLAGASAADMSGYAYLQGNLPLLLLALAAVYVVSSLGEEVIYRGFLMNRLAELGAGSRAAWGTAVVVSATVFGLVHFDWGPVGIIQTGFMGLGLALAYLAVRRNLWVLVLAHAGIDTLLLVQLYSGPGAAP